MRPYAWDHAAQVTRILILKHTSPSSKTQPEDTLIALCEAMQSLERRGLYNLNLPGNPTIVRFCLGDFEKMVQALSDLGFIGKGATAAALEYSLSLLLEQD